MSLQWTLVAGYLYFEVAVVAIMMLPIFSPRRWHQFFKSRLFYMFREHAAVYFYIFLGVLCLFLFDAVREMRKYSHGSDAVSSVHISTEMKGSLMLIIQDELSLKAEKIIKEAEATVKLAKSTVLKNTVQSSEQESCEVLKSILESTEDLLKNEKSRVRELEEEVKLWRSKYEEVNATASIGRGDE